MCPLGGRFLGGSGGLLRRIKMVCHCLLIETEGGLVLIDTGLGLADIDHPARLGPAFPLMTSPSLRRDETAIEQVRKLGFSPSDVRDIILTHLDVDHAGGLTDFPHATVHLFDDEYRAAMAPTLLEKARYRPAQWSHGVAWWPHRDLGGEPWFGFSCVRQAERLPPEILLVPLLGHTRGHMGVAVQTEKGWLLHAGDAYYNSVELGDGPVPSLLVGFRKAVAHDDEKRAQNVARLARLAREHRGEVTVFSAHDEAELASLIS